MAWIRKRTTKNGEPWYAVQWHGSQCGSLLCVDHGVLKWMCLGVVPVRPFACYLGPSHLGPERRRTFAATSSEDTGDDECQDRLEAVGGVVMDVTTHTRFTCSPATPTSRLCAPTFFFVVADVVESVEREQVRDQGRPEPQLCVRSATAPVVRVHE